nr:MAG TPA_asm: hypothetical protein [Caudoviricetes sp.]
MHFVTSFYLNYSKQNTSYYAVKDKILSVRRNSLTAYNKMCYMIIFFFLFWVYN